MVALRPGRGLELLRNKSPHIRQRGRPVQATKI